VMRVVRTKMSETATRTGNRDPIAWLRMTILQRTVYGDALCARLSTFPAASQCYKTHRAEKRRCFVAWEALGDRRDMRHIRNLIAPTTYHRQADEAGISYHVFGERPIHGVSAKFRFGAICESLTCFNIRVLVTTGSRRWLTYSVPSPCDTARTVGTNMRAT
jgi:hypothetical protein